MWWCSWVSWNEDNADKGRKDVCIEETDVADETRDNCGLTVRSVYV